jgi:transcriptional regulator with XRE-family HTH domain
MPPARKKPPLNPELAALGKAVERLRKERGLTQEELGAAVFTDHKLAGEIERGQRNPGYLTLVRLAAALGTSPGSIVSLADSFLAAGDGDLSGDV